MINFGSPLPVHEPFHASSAQERCMFGAFGSGKSYALCDEAIAWCLEQPGIRGLITRKTVPELRDTTEAVFFERLPQEIYESGEEKRTGGHVESFTFPNGSKILFRSIDDWKKHKSLNVGFIAWDEADEFDEETVLGMSSRIRQVEPTPEGKRAGAKEVTRRGMWFAANPAGHNWLYRRYVDPKSKVSNSEWFRSTSFDNPYLPPEYLASLLEYPEAWVRRFVMCQFDDFAGQIYEDWSWDTHVVPPLDNVPKNSTYWMAFDPGTRSPTAGLWVYLDQPNRRLIGVAEYQESRLDAQTHARAFRQIEHKHKMNVRWRVADPNVNTPDRGTNMQLSDQYRRLGYNFQLGPRRHRDRIPMLGQLIAMKRFVVTSECPMTYEQIKNYQWEDVSPHMRRLGVDPQEKPLKKDDHLVDCAQYLSSRFVTPIKDSLEPHDAATFDEKIYRLIREKHRQIGRPAPNHDLGGVIV